MTAADPCDECEAAALREVYAARNRLYYVLWAQEAPIPAIDRAIRHLVNAHRMFQAVEADQ